MSNSHESASEKLRRGQSLLASESDDPAILGTALISLHGALEDRLRELLAIHLPAQRKDIYDTRTFQWKEILAFSEEHLGLSKADSELIFQANTYRSTFAHGGSFRWNRDAVKRYAELIRQLWARGSRQAAPPSWPDPIKSVSPSAPPKPEYYLPAFELKKRPWYRSTGWYWFFFIFALPIWSMLILTDDQRRGPAKSIALLLFLVSMAAGYFLWSLWRSLPSPTPNENAAQAPTSISPPTPTAAPSHTPPADLPVRMPSAAIPTAPGTPAACQVTWEEYAGSDIAGKNRSTVWNELVSQRVSGSGMRAEEFYLQVVEHNPGLQADGYVFKSAQAYLLPRCQ